MATKHTSFYEETMRVPLIFNGPGLGASGHTVRGLCSLLDILPTLCDYAGIPIPKETEGQSLYPALTTGADDASLREAVFAHWFSEWGHTIEPGRMVRTHTYKYTHYREGFGEELYDLSADPGEVANLALKPGYAKVLQKHRVVLDEYIWRTGDPYRNFNYKVDPVFRESYPSYRNYAGPLACDRADLLPAPETLPRLFCT
jgi:choline-sulfatase